MPSLIAFHSIRRSGRSLLLAGLLGAVLGCTSVSPPRLKSFDAAPEARTDGAADGTGPSDVPIAGEDAPSAVEARMADSPALDGASAVDARAAEAAAVEVAAVDASVEHAPDAPVPSFDSTAESGASPLPAGATCATAEGCASGACVDGICCDQPCGGCFACRADLTGQADGTCAPVANGRDPREVCADETAFRECGQDGACDGAGACRKVGPSHVCTAPRCQGTDFLPATTCDGFGNCKSATGESCAPFGCSTTGCLRSCTGHGDCGPNNYCNLTTGMCMAKQVDGSAATAPEECISGVVADGVCCDKACTGICEACNSAARPGACVAVTTSRTPCAGAGAVCGGRCDGIQRATCTFPGLSTPCGTPASCTASTQTAATGCAGNGFCAQPATKPCGIFGCAGNECATSCPTGQTACPTACVNLLTDAKSCGACGHDCLGGSCQGGQCLPAVVLETSLHPSVFGLDPSYVYFSEVDSASGTADVFRVEKHVLGGSATAIATGLANPTLVGVAGPWLLWNESPSGAPRRATACEVLDCAATVAHPFAEPGELVPFNTPDPTSILLQFLDSSTWTLNLAWYGAGTTTPAQTAASSVALDAKGTAYGFFASGDGIYWCYWPPTAADDFSGSLYGKSASIDTQRPARLAGGMSFYTFIIDVNPQSVLMIDIQDFKLYRVPLPLGLGAAAPQVLTPAGMRVLAATEDATGVYWFDSPGTLYRCAPANCTATQTVLANGQYLGTSKLFQDAKALYWGTANPYRIVRLAK